MTSVFHAMNTRPSASSLRNKGESPHNSRANPTNSKILKWNLQALKNFMQIITGMHRSGTSLVAKIFYEVGADLGPKETLYPGDRWNPDGYYEQPAIHSINMALIHGPFWKFSYFFLAEPSRHSASRRKARGADTRGGSRI